MPVLSSRKSGILANGFAMPLGPPMILGKSGLSKRAAGKKMCGMMQRTAPKQLRTWDRRLVCDVRSFPIEYAVVDKMRRGRLL
jgi:hypothetical protein